MVSQWCERGISSSVISRYVTRYFIPEISGLRFFKRREIVSGSGSHPQKNGHLTRLEA